MEWRIRYDNKVALQLFWSSKLKAGLNPAFLFFDPGGDAVSGEACLKEGIARLFRASQIAIFLQNESKRNAMGIVQLFVAKPGE